MVTAQESMRIYENKEWKISFSYPASWGEFQLKKELLDWTIPAGKEMCEENGFEWFGLFSQKPDYKLQGYSQKFVLCRGRGVNPRDITFALKRGQKLWLKGISYNDGQKEHKIFTKFEELIKNRVFLFLYKDVFDYGHEDSSRLVFIKTLPSSEIKNILIHYTGQDTSELIKFAKSFTFIK